MNSNIHTSGCEWCAEKYRQIGGCDPKLCQHSCHQNHKEITGIKTDTLLDTMTPTPHLWEDKLKDAFYGDFSTYDMIDVKYEDIKDFIRSLLQERDKMASRYGNDRYNEGKQEGATQERERITNILEGMKKYIELHECQEILCPHFPRTDAHNFALTDALKKIGEKI